MTDRERKRQRREKEAPALILGLERSSLFFRITDGLYGSFKNSSERKEEQVAQLVYTKTVGGEG